LLDDPGREGGATGSPLTDITDDGCPKRTGQGTYLASRARGESPRYRGRPRL